MFGVELGRSRRLEVRLQQALPQGRHWRERHQNEESWPQSGRHIIDTSMPGRPSGTTTLPTVLLWGGGTYPLVG